MSRLAERKYPGVALATLVLALSLLSGCAKSPKTSTNLFISNTSAITGSIDNLSDFSLATADEFRVYALNVEGKHNYTSIETNGSFSINVPSSSLYILYVLQDSDADGSYENLIGTFDAVSAGALNLVPIYSTDLDLGTITLPSGGPGSVIDLSANPAIGKDMDADGVSDELDDDINGNGQDDSYDLVRLDFDEDNIPNPIDSDRDGDGINNAIDPNQFDAELNPIPYEQDSDGDGYEDIDDIEATSLYGNLNIHYVTGRISYVSPGEALTAVAITTKGRFIRSIVDDNGNFNIPMRERELFLLYFMSGNLISNGQSFIDLRGIVDPISGGAPTTFAMGSSNLNLKNLTLPGDPENRALNLSISILANRDSDGDGIRDSVDPDKDGNGINDATEALSLNFDADLFPNILDTDDDNDGDIDSLDTDRDGDSLPDPIDSDGDGISNSSDIDYDNDGQIDGTNPTLLETPDLDIPIVGTSISFPTPQIQPDSIRINWGYARDNASPANLLEYRVVYALPASSTNIDTASEIAALDPLALPLGVEIIEDWTANINTTDATGLDYPQLYFFAVAVRDEAGNMALYTPASQITVDSTAPTLGTGITTNSPAPGPNDISVAWGAGSDNVSLSGDLEYKLVYTTGATSTIDTVIEAEAAPSLAMDWTAATTSFNVAGLNEGITYAFAVLVRDSAGNKSLYAPATGTTTDVTAPVVADGPFFADLSDSSVTVEWDAANDNVTTSTNLQYKVVFSTTAGGSDIDDIGEANTTLNVVTNWTANITSTSATGLTQSTEYYFSVLVRDTSGNMSLYAPQSIITINSSAPDTLSDTISFPSKTATTIDVAWNEASDDVTPTNSLEYKLVMGTSATTIDTIAEADAILGANLIQDWTTDSQSGSATGLTSGVRYHFTVLVRDAALNVAIYTHKSTVTDDIVDPSAGTGPSFSGTTASQTSISWTAGTDNLSSPSSLSYKLVRSTDPLLIDEASEADTTPSSSFVVVMDWTAATLTANSTGLTDNTTYYYAVFVRDQSLNVSVYAPQSVTTLDGTAPVVQVPADNITFGTALETEVTVNWGEAADTVTIPANLQYKVVRGTAAADFSTAALAETNGTLVMDWTANTLTRTVTGLTASTTYKFAVLVKDAAGNVALYTPQSATTATPPNVEPVPGTNIIFSGTADTRTVLTWGIATDDLTAQASLQYKVVRGTAAADFSTAALAETNGTLVMDWTTNTLTRTVTGLTASTTYKFAVLVRDAAALKGLYTAQTVSTLAPMKVFFASNTSVAGSFTVASADSTCNSEGRSRFDATKTYKAVFSNGSTRTTSVDWTLAANTSYKDKNGIFIGTTNPSKVFSFPLSQALDSTLATNVFAWTGLNSNWSNATNNCSGWTSNKNSRTGQAGSPFSSSSTSITASGATRKCGSTSRYYCAEQ